jgi:uncharacterized pyridoxal phosphate-dependent enzyme
MVTYSDLSVRPVINAWGTVTSMGGSLMEEEVLMAMVEAGRNYVPIPELQEAVGHYIAKKLGVDSAFVCAGAASGMALAAAACIAGTNPSYRSRLPESDGLKNEIIMFRAMRFGFDQGFREAGAKIIEIGWPNKVELWELEMAFSNRTAAVAYIVESAYPGLLSLETVIETAHKKAIPVIVDAAAEIPPKENLLRYNKLGADLTIYSGGKDIRGPQSTGLIIGKKDLIEACVYNSSPNYSIGRGMKVGKEEIMGFVNALDLWLKQDFEKEMENWEEQVAIVLDELSGFQGISARRVFPCEPGIQPIWIPRVYINWSPDV